MSSYQLLSLDYVIISRSMITGTGQVYPKAQQVGQWGQTLSQLWRNCGYHLSKKTQWSSMDISPRETKDEAQTECLSWFVPTRSSLQVAGCAAKGVLAMLVGLRWGLWLSCHAGTLPRLHRVLEQQWLQNSSHPARWDSSRVVTLGQDSDGSHFSPWSAAHLVSAVDLESLCLCFCHMSLSLWQLGSCSRVMLIYWQ